MQIVIVGLALAHHQGKIGPGVLFANMILGSRALARSAVVAPWSSLVAGQQAYDAAGRPAADLRGPAAGDQVAAAERPAQRRGGQFARAARPSAPERHPRSSFRLARPWASRPFGRRQSTLTRSWSGCGNPTAGWVRLDGADVFQLGPRVVRQYVGYLPQDVELFSGTVRRQHRPLPVTPPMTGGPGGQLAGPTT